MTSQPVNLASPSPLTDGSLVLSSSGLTYVSGSNAQPIVETDAYLSPTNGMATLTGVTAVATLGGIQSSPINYSASVADSGSYRFAVQVNAAGLPTGRYDWQMTITQTYSDSSQLKATYFGQQDVLNWNSSPYGLAPNWSLSGMDYLVPGVGRREPRAKRRSMGFFWSNGAGGYTSENGPFAFDTLSGNWTNGFTLTGTDGTAETFNPSGTLATVTDADGNVTQYNYPGGVAHQQSSIPATTRRRSVIPAGWSPRSPTSPAARRRSATPAVN